ncbi:MAG: single-stranded-DNA-specific exonuclease RecJ, partial [Clostridia bacterium]|nr:single-stranded-DNA-specific exonuclease RecJ [Clostridia bacterium]
GENRVLVREGLRLINAGTRPGLTALAEVAGAGGKVQTSTSAVFTLAPRINASGRMGDPHKAAELLLAETPEEAAELAAEINGYNVERQRMESVTMEEVTARIDAHPEWMTDRVLVIDGENWSSGIVGILAARILERYGKPCMLLSVLPDKVKGSGRSFKGFPLFDAIASCADILTSFGGHELAAGVSLTAEHVKDFRRRINEYAAEHFPVMPVPTLTLDCKISPAQVKLDILDHIARLEPFGTGNPFPVFGLYHMTLQDITPVGGGKHLRLSLTRDGASLTVMWFHMTEADCPFLRGDTVDIAATFDRNEFRGVASVTVIVKDIAFSQADRESWLDAVQQFDELRRDGRSALTKTALLPEREELAVIYRYLRAKNGFTGRWDGLRRRLPAAIPPLRLRLCLEILRQAGLLTVTDRGDSADIAVLPTTSKADLTQTPLWKTIDNLS